MTDKEIAALNAEIDEEFAFGLYLKGFFTLVAFADEKEYCTKMEKVRGNLLGNIMAMLDSDCDKEQTAQYPHAVANKIAALMMKLPPRARIATLEKMRFPDYFGATKMMEI